MKTLEIEWRHLEKDEDTCIRCSDTGEALNEVISKIAYECRPHGWEIIFKESKLTEKDVSESNLILFNGEPIESVLPEAKVSESSCKSCSKLISEPSTSCRTLEVEGRSYEGIPSSIIRQAVCQITKCC